MFGMRKLPESERLRAVYADQSDGELLRLHEEREGLTDVAKEALAEVMSQRGLDAVAKDATEARDASGSPAQEQVDGLGTNGQDNVPLYTFANSAQAQDLLRLLEEADIPFGLGEGSYVRWAGLRGTREPGVTVFVQKPQEEKAKEYLRQAAAMYGIDREEARALAFTPPSDLVVLLTCERADAISLVSALSKAGISFYWRDGREDVEVAGEDIVALEVYASNRERADEIVQQWAT